MAADQQQLTQDGQEVQQLDLNNIARQAARSEDYVLAEMLRLAPYSGSSVAKAVIPWGAQWGQSFANNALVQATAGGVKIFPCRFIAGPRSAISAYVPATNAPALISGQNNPTAVENARGIRSALYVPTDDNANLGHFVALANNSSGNARIDLVYATMTVDTQGALVSRMVRPPVVNSSPAPANLSTQVVQPVTIGVVTGTPSGTPATPALPADNPGSNIFNFPLAYVMVPSGFNSASSTAGNIQAVAPVVQGDGRVTGGTRVRPATCITTDLSQVPLAAWANGTPPEWALASTMAGGESLFFGATWNNATPSIADGAVVDNSIDWRGRAFLWFAQLANGSQAGFTYTNGFLSPVAPTGNVGHLSVPKCWSGQSGGSSIIVGMGQSFGIDDTASITGMGVGSTRGGGVVAALTSNEAPGMGAGISFALYVEQGTGLLKAYSTLTHANFGGIIFLWLFATAQADHLGV